MADFLMPSLGADMETGKLVQWLVKPGDRVKSGDVVAVVETHKGAIDVEIFLDGVIDNLAPLDQEVPVGTVLATVRQSGETAAPAVAAVAPAAVSAPVPVMTEASAEPARSAANVGRIRISPAARQRAQQLGVELAALVGRGTGEGGAVCLRDVEAAVSRHPAEAAAATGSDVHRGFDPAQMRLAIAAAMGRSKREIPHYYLSDSIDFTAAAQWLAAWNAGQPPEQRLLPAVLLLKACARALQAYPQFNGFYQDGGFRGAAGIHPGWAVSLRGGGLVAPAIHDVDRLTLPQLMTAMRDLVQRARAGSLRSSELADPSITVTNLGERGAESVLGVIYPPQVAIIGFGRVQARPWVLDGQLAVREMLNVSLAADHRVTDGHLGGQLLAAIGNALQHPDTL
ncbi:dihydrolipoamide acetyltransferase family protein [Vogesella indigofera]|uniref:dihydrolipoamide acetyltransferase family protein n=1 Tax=Vogesella indigofera TaxID=45465 RepID=UPI00234CCC85|nr:dihydrolipoamide acetyltransferase family protein [Vogesella indigofera]MDC7704596.1 dihydrolipoamide acetyltransferase family protein [Vogesella indigofera]